jgi:hypothetical protein
MQRTKISAPLIAVALLIAACSAGANEASPPATEPPATELAVTVSPPPAPAVTVAEPTAAVDPDAAQTIEQVNEYIAQAAAFDQAGADIQFPQGLTFQAGGAPGYSRYVFREHAEGVVPSLVEGPIVGAVRCQDEIRTCSRQELKALAASDEAIPGDLQMTADELDQLVAQLDELNVFAEAHGDVNTACAEGYISDRTQTANMGSHFYKIESIGNGFDPGEPEILLYALADGSARILRERRLERRTARTGRYSVHHPAGDHRQRSPRDIRRAARQLAHPLQPVSRRSPRSRHVRSQVRVRSSRRAILCSPRLDVACLGR